MASKQPPMPGLRTAEDANPPRLPKPTAEETKPDIRTALFGCPHRDPLPSGRKRRNLIVNLDGTSNQFSANSTNVVELFSRIIKSGGDVEQLVYYNSGIGTYARPSFRSFSYWKQALYNHIDTAIAWNFERIVHAAYKWLSENYEPGDRIFLFGFSRGAYQIRVIAGMIETVGLLHKGNETQIAFAYELYTAVMAHSKRGATQTNGERGQNEQQAHESDEEQLCSTFKQSLCHEDVKVHFVGAWDTVSSIGVFRGKSLPETVSGMGHVCHFRHALALDERRAKFQPEYVNGGLGPTEGEKQGDVKEVWFKGTHSDIGGGNIQNKYLNNFSDSLRWMTFEAQSCGLLVKPYTGKWVPVTPKESLTWFWMLLEIIPFGALSYMDKDSLTWWPHLGQPRTIQPGQFIHQSVFGTLPKHSGTHDASSEGDVEDEDSLETTFEASLFETRPVCEEVIDESDASVKMPGSFHVAKVPELKSLSMAYCPKAIFHPLLKMPNWSTLFSQYSPTNDFIEPDPFENASHILNSLSRACDALSSGQGDQGSTLYSLAVGIQTLQSFLDDPTRLSSLLEVPEAQEILLKAITTAVRQTSTKLTQKSKGTLVRLFARALAAYKQKTVVLLPAPEEIPTAWGSRITPAQVYQWGLEVRATHREDLLIVLRVFGLSFLLRDKGRYPSFLPSCMALIAQWPTSEIVHDVAFLGADPSHIIFTYRAESKERIEVASICDGSAQPAKNMILQCRGSWSRISRDGCHVAVADGGEVSIINTTTEPPLVTEAILEEEHIDSGDITSRCFSDDYQTLASGHENGWITLWQKEEGQWKVFKRFKGGDHEIWCLAFSRDGTRLVFVFGGIEPTKVWSSLDDSLIELEDSQETQSLAWSPSGDWIAAGTADGGVKIWSPDRGNIAHTCKAHGHPIWCLAFRHDGQVFATGSFNCRIRIWRCHDWEKVWEFDVGRPVLSLAFSPDGKRLASGSLGLYLWDVDMEDIEDIV